MSCSQTRRFATVMVVLVSLVFSQLALAQYVCPAGAQAVPIAMEMSPGQPCSGMDMDMDTDQPVLCHQHCANAGQSFEPVKVPAATLPAVLHVVVLPPLMPQGIDAGFASTAVRATPPPTAVFLSTLRLRV